MDGLNFDPYVGAADLLEAMASEKPPGYYRARPVEWVQDIAKYPLWSRQKEVLNSIVDHRRTAVHACHAVGKSLIAALAASWWIDSHPPGEAFVLTTAPTAPQVRAILWRYINQIHNRAGLIGRCNQTEWHLPNGDSEEMVAIGRKPSEHDEGTFQGIHARYVLVIIDEGSGVPRALWDGTETIASNEHARILTIGNPDVTTGPFAEACHATNWHTIHIGFEHSPAATGEKVPPELLEGLISKEWAEDRKQSWGEESALYQAKVLGHFPTGSTDPFQVMDPQALAQCRYIEPNRDGPHVVGIDVGAGGDRTVLVNREGNAVTGVVSFDTPDPMDAVAKMQRTIVGWGAPLVNIDVAGIGWGVAGRLKEVLSGVAAVRGVNFAARSGTKKFLNIRAVAWWNGRELTRNGKWSLGELDDDTIAELAAPRYEIMDSNGRIKIESKDYVRSQLGRSPDVADALLLAFLPGSDHATGSATAGFGAVKKTQSGTAGGSVYGGAGRNRPPASAFGK